MPNYAKGKIYRVVDTDDKTVYIGSTCQTLSQRFTRHVHKGNGNRILLIEDCPCENKEHLLRREQEVMEQHRDLLNRQRAYRSPEQIPELQKEYREANRDKIREKNKELYQANRDKILEKKKEYREANRDKIREHQKEYHEANRDKIRENQKEYRKANRDKIRARGAERVICEHCGTEVARHSLARHKRTAKCKAHQPISPGASDNISVSDPVDRAQPASPVCKSNI